MQLISNLAYWMSPNVRNFANPSRLVEPRTFKMEYRNPVLYLTETGNFDVVCNYYYGVVPIYNTDNQIIDYQINDLDNSSGDYEIFLQ